ncbi:hypothetical protein SLS55_002587 [Diplodia seriata]|uniref:Uncharacterized protein n=1 Tax=Diplodia seriata TaxID=420778 RepID=A0ABR3CSM3_9PEZI
MSSIMNTIAADVPVTSVFVREEPNNDGGAVPLPPLLPPPPAVAAAVIVPFKKTAKSAQKTVMATIWKTMPATMMFVPGAVSPGGVAEAATDAMPPPMACRTSETTSAVQKRMR